MQSILDLQVMPCLDQVLSLHCCHASSLVHVTQAKLEEPFFMLLQQQTVQLQHHAPSASAKAYSQATQQSTVVL